MRFSSRDVAFDGDVPAAAADEVRIVIPVEAMRE
jgi:hypothetical protein